MGDLNLNTNVNTGTTYGSGTGDPIPAGNTTGTPATAGTPASGQTLPIAQDSSSSAAGQTTPAAVVIGTPGGPLLSPPIVSSVVVSTPSGSGTGAPQLDANGNVIPPQVDANGNAIPPQFDANGNVIPPQFDANGNVIAPQFDANGNVIPPQFDANGHVIPPQFDANGNVIPPQVDASGNIISTNVVTSVNDVTSSLTGALAALDTGAITFTEDGYATSVESFAALFGNTLQTGQDTITAQIEALKLMPDDTPGKMEMLNFLNAVSEAITELQDLLRTMQSSDAKSAQGRIEAQLDSSLAKVNAQLEAIQESKEKAEDASKKANTLEKLGLSTQAINIIIMVVMVIVAIPAIIGTFIANPVAGAIVCAFLIVCIVDMAMKIAGEDGVFTEMSNGIGELVSMAYAELDPTASQDEIDAVALSCKVIVCAAIIAAVVWANPSVALLVGAGGIASMVSSCEIGSEIARLSGADESTQMWCEFAVTCATMVVCLAGSLKTGGLAIADDVVNVTNKLAQNALALSAKLGTRGAQAVIAVSTSVTQSLLSTGEAVVNNNLMDIYADMAQITADADSEAAIKDALIKVLKDIIKKLQDAISGVNDFLGTLNTMQSNLYSNLSANALSFPG
jgi:hypothetical protein